LNTLFALVSWQLWRERNAPCFWDNTASVIDTVQAIKREELDPGRSNGSGSLSPRLAPVEHDMFQSENVQCFNM
jgi:hypothetical protein